MTSRQSIPSKQGQPFLSYRGNGLKAFLVEQKRWRQSDGDPDSAVCQCQCCLIKVWMSEAFDIWEVALSLMEVLTEETITVEVLVQKLKLLPESSSR